MVRVAYSANVRHSVLDLWLALLAGDQVWVDGETEPSTRDQIAASLAVFATSILIVIVWSSIVIRIGTLNPRHLGATDRRFVALGIFTSGAALLLAYHPLRILRKQTTRPAAFFPALLIRGLSYLTVIIGVTATLPRLHLLGAWPIGVLGGADGTLTIWVLGASPEPIRWIRRFFFGPLHFGVLGGLVGSSIVLGHRPSTWVLFSLYLAMWVGLIGAGAALLVLDSISQQLDQNRVTDRADIAASEREYRAHWIHDDVLSEVQLASLRIASGTNSPRDIHNELLELDHRLRLRQLDETFRGGDVHIYEVVQPHLRRAQALNIELQRVPPHEATQRKISEADGRLMSRTISILTSNAINAGTTRLAVDLDPTERDDVVCLSITDDAGGFDLASIPAGRGLSTLIRDLGPNQLSRSDADGGSTISVLLPASAMTHESEPT